jgi:hypothetical protein
MQINGKEYTQAIDINDRLCAYRVYFCADYVSATILWKDSKNHSTQIGYLTCLNHPSKDGTNPHWQIILEVDRSHGDKINQISLNLFAEILKRTTPVKEPIWIELREFDSKTSNVVGDLWNND